jgi:hypothetical protein
MNRRALSFHWKDMRHELTDKDTIFLDLAGHNTPVQYLSHTQSNKDTIFLEDKGLGYLKRWRQSAKG